MRFLIWTPARISRVEDGVGAVGADVAAGRAALGAAVDEHAGGDEAVEDPVGDVEADDVLAHGDVAVLDAALVGARRRGR